MVQIFVQILQRIAPCTAGVMTVGTDLSRLTGRARKNVHQSDFIDS